MSHKATANNELYVHFPFYQTIKTLGDHTIDRRLWGKQKPHTLRHCTLRRTFF